MIAHVMIAQEMNDRVTSGHAEEKIEMTVVMKEIEIDSTMMIEAVAREQEVAVEVRQENGIEVEFGSESRWKEIGSVTYTAGNGNFILWRLYDGKLAVSMEL